MDSMDTISIWIPGKPAPQARPRLGRGHVYSPEPSGGWKDAVALALSQATRRPPEPYAGAVKVTMHFHIGEGCRLVVEPDADAFADVDLYADGYTHRDA